MNFWNQLFGKNTNPKIEALTLKERLAALQNLPAFLKLVWKSSPGMTVLDSLLRVTRSVIPLSVLYIGELIIDQVVMLSRSKGAHYAELFYLRAEGYR